MSIQISKPGKLYLAGEYAVLSGQSKAIITQTKVKLHVTISSDTVFKISDENQHLLMLFSSYEALVEELSEPYVKEAILFCHHYLKTLNIHLKPFHLSIESDLKVNGLEKLGLGSSAALTVAAIDACLTYHGVILEPIELYKAAVLTQIKKYPHSSFGDIACSAFDHAITYQKFDASWLEQNIDKAIHYLLKEPWPNLEIKKFKMPKLNVLIIYTNQPADSQVFVKTIEDKTNKDFYKTWIHETGTYVNDMILHLDQVEHMNIMEDISKLNKQLKILQDHTNIALFTQTMIDIESKVIEAKGAFKFSGAGGGDCVIALFKNNKDCIDFKLKIKDTYHIINDMFEGLS
ncbi:MAG: phosphomevalonate kinase [Acholeplasmataceae bacterium]